MADDAFGEFNVFVQKAPNFEQFTSFDRTKHRLGDIYFETMITNGSKNFSKASVVTQKLLILSHGQATVERGSV